MAKDSELQLFLAAEVAKYKGTAVLPRRGNTADPVPGRIRAGRAFPQTPELPGRLEYV